MIECFFNFCLSLSLLIFDLKCFGVLLFDMQFPVTVTECNHRPQGDIAAAETSHTCTTNDLKQVVWFYSCKFHCVFFYQKCFYLFALLYKHFYFFAVWSDKNNRTHFEVSTVQVPPKIFLAYKDDKIIEVTLLFLYLFRSKNDYKDQ